MVSTILRKSRDGCLLFIYVGFGVLNSFMVECSDTITFILFSLLLLRIRVYFKSEYTIDNPLSQRVTVV